MTIDGDSGPRFDPQAYAAVLVQEVMPTIFLGEVQSWPETDVQEAIRRNETSEENESALLAATETLAPPRDLPNHGSVYAVVMGVVALKASTREYALGIPNPNVRYSRAADWVCDNLGEAIWWNCHKS
jgi:hypothetical protein